MNRSEVLQEIRLMKFDDLYSRRTAGKLTQEQAAEILGISVGTMRRWEERYEAEGAEGLYDRRRGKLANNRVPADTAMEMLELFDTRYWDYTPKHFHEKLVAHHGFTQSYNWVRLTLQRHGRVQPAPRRGAHRRKRARRPMVGMMLSVFRPWALSAWPHFHLGSARKRLVFARPAVRLHHKLFV